MYRNQQPAYSDAILKPDIWQIELILKWLNYQEGSTPSVDRDGQLIEMRYVARQCVREGHYDLN